jgi:hypothetical protein
VERENAFFKSSLVDEYHLPQMNSEKKYFGCMVKLEAVASESRILAFIRILHHQKTLLYKQELRRIGHVRKGLSLRIV